MRASDKYLWESVHGEIGGQYGVHVQRYNSCSLVDQKISLKLGAWDHQE